MVVERLFTFNSLFPNSLPFPTMIHFFNVSCIFLSNFIFYAIATHQENFEAKHPRRIAAADFLRLDYDSFVTDIDGLSRACSVRLLTNSARVVVAQQNIHTIIRILFGDYRLVEHFFEGYDAHSKRLNDDGKSNTDVIDVLAKKNFIGYFKALQYLYVVRVVRNDQNGTRSFKHYLVPVKLPSVKVLYSRMVAQGIDLNFLLRMLPRMISFCEISIQIRSPDFPDLSKFLNDLVKQFIWEHCGAGKEIESVSALNLKYLAKEIFRKDLNAQLCTIRQGDDGFLYSHIIGDRFKICEDRAFRGICYLRNSIEFIERCKLPSCPSTMYRHFNDKFHYCIYNYNSDKSNKIKTNDSEERQAETSTSLLKEALPLMKVSEGTLLSTHLVFPKERLIKLLESKQRSDFKKMKSTNQGNEDDTPSYSSMISDEQLGIFMNHFTAYLYTDSNQQLFEAQMKWE